MTGENWCQPVFSGQLNRLGPVLISSVVVYLFWMMVQTGCSPSCPLWGLKNWTELDLKPLT